MESHPAVTPLKFYHVQHSAVLLDMQNPSVTWALSRCIVLEGSSI